MLLQPRKTKYRKLRKGSLKRLEFKSNKLQNGDVGLKVTESGFVGAKQIEAARRAVTRKLNRKGKVWIKIFPDYPVTRKPGESRMGKGKGNVSFWASKVSAGRVLFEVCGVPVKLAKEALESSKHKLALKTKIVCR